MSNNNEHTVPQFLLRKFALPIKEEHYISVYEKHTDKFFQPNIKGIAAQRGFYDFNLNTEKVTIEPFLAFIEGTVGDIIDKIINKESTGFLSIQEKDWLFLFVLIQYFRVDKQRAAIKEISTIIYNNINSRKYNPNKLMGIKEYDDNDAKIASMYSVINNSRILLPMMHNKLFVLYKFTSDSNLYISDHPVVMSNNNGPLGFCTTGVEIYLPIHSKFALAFLCPTFETITKNTMKEILFHEQNINLYKKSILETQQYKLRIKCKNEKKKGVDFLNAIKNGKPLVSNTRSLKYLNQLQVEWSSRFVMSQDGDFSLVEQMIKNDDRLRHGIAISYGFP